MSDDKIDETKDEKENEEKPKKLRKVIKEKFNVSDTAQILID